MAKPKLLLADGSSLAFRALILDLNRFFKNSNGLHTEIYLYSLSPYVRSPS